MKKTAAIVLAAGKGSRMKSDVQKQFLLLKEKPILYYSLKAFQDSPVSEIILVTGADTMAYCKKEIVEKYNLDKVTEIVAGGAERYVSVYHGLQAVADADYVLIHDGARPFLQQDIIQRTMEGAVLYGACVAAMPVKDTIKIADPEGFVIETPDRSALWGMQTPQAFELPLIRKAYDMLMESPVQNVTDDAMVAEQMLGTKIKLVYGAYTNLKITTPEDMDVAQSIYSKIWENI